jgi:hypothetical protein
MVEEAEPAVGGSVGVVSGADVVDSVAIRNDGEIVNTRREREKVRQERVS